MFLGRVCKNCWQLKQKDEKRLAMFEVKRGCRVVFTDRNRGILEGFVNGDPYVVAYQRGGTEAGEQRWSLGARVPVHVPSIDWNVDVAGHNIKTIERAGEPLAAPVEPEPVDA